MTDRGSSLGNEVDSWLSGLVAWVSPWAAIMLIHYYFKKRGRIDVPGLYADWRHAAIGDINWAAMVSFLAGLVAAWSFMYGGVAVLQGPFSRHHDGIDLSWLVGMIVAGLLYLLLEPRYEAVRLRRRVERMPQAAEAEA